MDYRNQAGLNSVSDKFVDVLSHGRQECGNPETQSPHGFCRIPLLTLFVLSDISLPFLSHSENGTRLAMNRPHEGGKLETNHRKNLLPFCTRTFFITALCTATNSGGDSRSGSKSCSACVDASEQASPRVAEVQRGLSYAARRFRWRIVQARHARRV